jgi:arylformamidase
MNIIDISWPITERMTTYKNNNKITLENISKSSSDATEHRMTMHTHTGTHVDAPLHFLKDGKSIDQIPLTQYLGPCRVIALDNDVAVISESVLKKFTFEYQEIIVFKTKNSALANDAPFNAEFVYLDKSGAEYLVKQNIKTIGIDYLGIERNQPDHETHKLLLSKGCGILEGLRLAHVHEGHYVLVCLPLALAHVDGAPARAVLLQM